MTWKLHPKIDQQQLRDHLAAVMNGRWDGRDLICAEGTVSASFSQPLDGEVRGTRNFVYLSLEALSVAPMRCGLGSRFLSALRDWCDYTGYRLLIVDIIPNPDFWDRFAWLSEPLADLYCEAADDQLWYVPNPLLASQRRARELAAA